MLKTGKFVGYLTMDTEVTDSMPSERMVKEGWRGYVKPSRYSRSKSLYAITRKQVQELVNCVYEGSLIEDNLIEPIDLLMVSKTLELTLEQKELIRTLDKDGVRLLY